MMKPIKAIDVDALRNRIHGPERPEIYDGMDEVFWIEQCINEAPALSIVHCGECRFWDSPPSCEGLAKCVTGESGIRYRSKNDFCSKGVPLPDQPKEVE